ncbi:MAG: tetratricopeptide repeat protein, partial [Muribaculaceae bacterium]|nr:tetratricopeptide repeat protein [Muribaculaceae bacterium]
FDNLRRMHQVQEQLYAEAYEAYLDNDNSVVHRLTAGMETDYPLSPILPKFVFIDALSYLTENNPEEFRERLTLLLQRWPDTDMTDMASAILKKLKAGYSPQTGGTNSRGMIWDIRLTENAAEEADERPEANFELLPDAPHYVVFAFPKDSVNANLVLYDVARFNFSSFVVKDFDLEPMSFSNIGLLVVKGFANLREAEHYLSVLGAADTGLSPEVRPIVIAKANFELLLREGRSFEEYFRFRDNAEADAAENNPITR